MTIDLAQLTRIYLHRNIPNADDYSFKLISKYSNEDITTQFNITYITQTEHNNWSEILFAVYNLDPNKDYNGYYELQVGYLNPLGAFVMIESNLVKVKYQTTSNTFYQSDNENNEQFVYYRK